jgi:hypothetical protein
MSYWEGPSRWINALLLFILSFFGFDAFFRLLNARDENFIVGLVRAVANFFLAPFNGMFNGQSWWLTTLIAVLGYCLLAGIALAVTKSVQAGRRTAAARARQREAEDEYAATARALDRAEERR